MNSFSKILLSSCTFRLRFTSHFVLELDRPMQFFLFIRSSLMLDIITLVVIVFCFIYFLNACAKWIPLMPTLIVFLEIFSDSMYAFLFQFSNQLKRSPIYVQILVIILKICIQDNVFTITSHHIFDM